MRPVLEVADIVRAHGDEFRRAHAASLSRQQKRVLRSIELCRTAALGGHLERCDQCGHERNAYNSCADRHCPKCQSLARAKWLEKRQAELLACEYFHVVFTLPAELAALALQNKRAMYDLLFRATADTLQSIAADPEHLGAQIGFFCILHSWGQTLHFHPHLHCVVPGGGISPDGDHWVACRPGFFLPVNVQEKARTAGHPMVAVRGNSATGHDTVQVGMKMERLPPGVQDAEKADLRSQVFRICGNGL